jgi:hypothetical protein
MGRSVRRRSFAARDAAHGLRERHRLVRPYSRAVVAEVSTPLMPDGLAFDGQTVWLATERGPQLAGIEALGEATPYRVADEGLINANQVMVFAYGSLRLPILERGVVLRVARPFVTVE